jgi:tetratricopeptide (TPR) repeat protein
MTAAVLPGPQRVLVVAGQKKDPVTMRDPEAERYYQQAVDRAIRKDFAGALPLYDEAIARDPGNAQYFSDRAITLIALGRNADAVETALRASEIDPAMPEPWINRGVALGNLGRYNEAETALERAVSLAPDNPYAHKNLALVYEKTGRPERAVEEFRKVRGFLHLQNRPLVTPWLVTGAVLGFVYYGVSREGSAFLKYAIIIMALLTSIFALSSYQQALIIKKAECGLAPHEERLIQSFAAAAVNAVFTIAIVFAIGYVLGWAADLLLF